MACARAETRANSAPSAAAPAPSLVGRAADECSSARPASRAWPAHHRSAGGPSADSPAPAATRTREPQPAAAAVHAGPLPAATSGERALDAAQKRPWGSPEAHAATNEADGKLRLPPILPILAPARGDTNFGALQASSVAPIALLWALPASFSRTRQSHPVGEPSL